MANINEESGYCEKQPAISMRETENVWLSSAESLHIISANQWLSGLSSVSPITHQRKLLCNVGVCNEEKMCLAHGWPAAAG